MGVCDGLKSDDLVFATYRSHVLISPKAARSTPCSPSCTARTGCVSGGKRVPCRGGTRGGHGSSASWPEPIPHAVGAALSFKRRGASQIAVRCSAPVRPKGRLSESLKLRGVMKVPGVFLCEDTGSPCTALGRCDSPIADRACRRSASPRAGSRKLDMLAIRQAPIESAARVRAGEPFVLEISTSRYKEHVGVGEISISTIAPATVSMPGTPRSADRRPKLAAALRPEIDREIGRPSLRRGEPAPGRAELLTT